MKCKQSSKGKTITLGELAKKHDIDLENDILVTEKKARYCTHLVKLDTKQYGLPQKVVPKGVLFRKKPALRL